MEHNTYQESGTDEPTFITCVYCGNNPVPHFLNWYFESINVLFTPLRVFLLHNALSGFLQNRAARWHMAEKIVSILEKCGVVSYNHDRSLCVITRAQVLWEDAERRGVTMSEMLLFGKPFDTYRAEKEISTEGGKAINKKIIFSGLPRPLGYDRKSLDTMDDKLILKRKLQKAGLPVPAGGTAASVKQAKRIFNRIEKPVIVKPRAGSRGRHSTTFVSTEKDLRAAVRVAKQLCQWVIVEEQLFGPVYRATVINYTLQGVLRGDAPFVIGNGRQSIAELIALKNEQPHPGVKNIIADQRTEMFLARQGMSLAFMPPTGLEVMVTEKVGLGYGGSSSEDFPICHKDNKQLFEQAARAVADPIVGFDFIIADITKSYKEQKCGFIEANSLPFIDLHHHPLLGQSRNVAKSVWELVGM